MADGKPDPMTDEPDRMVADFARFAATRDRRLRNQLVEAHAGLARHIAGRFVGGGRDRADVDQVALLGLVKAVDRFDHDRGVAFSTFAGRTIEGELKRHLRDATWAARVPRSVKELHLRIRRASEQLGHDLGRAPTVAELAQHVDASTDDVLAALSAGSARRAESLDAPAPGDPGPRHDVAREDDHGFGRIEDREAVERLLETLDPREREIVRLRFWENLSQDEIAERVGISQMHVSRLLRRSFAAMRDRAAGAEDGDTGGGAD